MKNYKIYMHKNKINNKVYIGQTYTSLNERFGKNGSRYNGCTVFYNAIQKYGWDNFEHIVLEENICNKEEANKKEKYYISLYNSTNRQYGYNIQDGGYEQTILSIPVHQYTLNGDYIKEFPSIAEAERALNIKHVCSCCSGKRKSAGGYLWSYTKCDNLDRYFKESNSRQVHKYNLDGVYLQTYEHLTDAVKELGVSNGAHISNCCNGTRETAYGFMWSYDKKNKLDKANNIHKQGMRVYQYDFDGNLVNIFNNSVDASNIFDNNSKAYCSINNCLNKKSKSAYGYIWIYEDMLEYFNLSDYIQYSGKMRKIKQYDKNMNLIKIYNSISEACKEIKGSTGSISRCCKGETNTAYGYIWKYA